MKKILKIVLVVIAALVLFLVAAPFIFKGKILNAVKTELNNNILAKVDFKDFDLTLLSSFPNLTMKLSDLSVVGVNEFDGDTLAGIKQLSVTVDLMSVLSGSQVKIRKVELDQARLQFLVLTDGKANWDIAKPSADTTAASGESQFDISLKYYAIRNSNLVYDDASLGFYLALQELNHEGTGDFTSDLFTLVTHTSSSALTMSYEGVAWIYKAKTEIDAELEMDMAHSKYSFKKNTIRLSELQFGVDGYVAMPGDPIEMDLKFDAAQNDFKNFMSLVPGVYREGFDKVQSSGKLAFNGFVKGVYSETTMPGFGVKLLVDKGQFRYPDLPTSINNVAVDLSIQNPDGVPDHTLIDLNKLHVEFGSEPFDARMTVRTPVSDADIDAAVRGRIDLANMSKMIPLEQGTKLAGVLNANLTAKGRVSAIENHEYEKFQAAGSLLLSDFRYADATNKEGINIDIAEMIFNPKNVTLNRLEMKSGKTTLKAHGWVDNLLSYLFKENELLKGTLDLEANVIDLNEWMSDEASATPADTAPSTILEVPKNIDFLMTVAIGQVIYEDLTLNTVNGNIAIRDQSLGMNQLSFGMLDGSVLMNGLYETKDRKNPNFYYDLDIKHMNIRKTYDSFVAVQQLAPIAKQCSGFYSASFDVRGKMDEAMEPVTQSMTGRGKLSTTSVIIENFTPLVKLAEKLKMDEFKKLDVKDANLSFSFENGRVNIEPFDVKLDEIKSTVSGSNGFDQTMDYSIKMKIPVSMMGSQATGVVSGWIADANKKAGTNMSMGNEVDVNARITGTVTDPKIETGIKDIAASTAASVKEQLKEEFDTKKKEIEDQAKAEADRLKKEAEDKAKAEADRLKKEAEDKAKAESEKAKKKAEEAAKKAADEQLKNLFGKPKK